MLSEPLYYIWYIGHSHDTFTKKVYLCPSGRGYPLYIPWERKFGACTWIKEEAERINKELLDGKGHLELYEG